MDCPGRALRWFAEGCRDYCDALERARDALVGSAFDQCTGAQDRFPVDSFADRLAVDVLFPDDPDGIAATGFIVAGPWDLVGHTELKEGTMDKKITRTLDRDDMVANTMSTFCSLTVHCARCHNHKFDPITQK